MRGGEGVEGRWRVGGEGGRGGEGWRKGSGQVGEIRRVEENV